MLLDTVSTHWRHNIQFDISLSSFRSFALVDDDTDEVIGSDGAPYRVC